MPATLVFRLSNGIDIIDWSDVFTIHKLFRKIVLKNDGLKLSRFLNATLAAMCMAGAALKMSSVTLSRA